MEMYSYPTDLANLFKAKMPEILAELADNNEKFCLQNSGTGMQPIIENKKYKFLQVDIGFFVWSLIEYLKKNVAKTQKELSQLELLESDFLQEDDSFTLSRNLKFLVNVLTFYKLSSLPKNNAYSKILYENKLTGVKFYLNSIIISKDVASKYITNNYVNEKILKFAQNKNMELIAYDRQIKKYLDELRQSETEINIDEFWSRKNGLNRKLLV